MLCRETPTASASCCCVHPRSRRSSRTRLRTLPMTSALYVRRRRRVKRACLGVVGPRSRDLPVRVVGPPERKLACEPGAERVVEPRVVATFVGGGRDPPAHVDVVAKQLFGELGAPAERVEIAAAEIRSG